MCLYLFVFRCLELQCFEHDMCLAARRLGLEMCLDYLGV